MSSTRSTVRLPQDVKDQLDRLSAMTKRTSSSLAAQAISSYVARETDIVGGIARGIADMKAGRLVPHADAMREITRLIDRAERARE
jgi:predicted transcriptional regulator